MTDQTMASVARRLEERRGDLTLRLAGDLRAALCAPGRPAPPALPQQHLLATAQRFHELVQAGATLDWSIVPFEYGWTSRVLPSYGVSLDHQHTLIDCYFSAIEGLETWPEDERLALEQLRTRIHASADEAYERPTGLTRLLI
ncbi:MAG TPA: hypothetical protein VFS21_13740 [Roseiflexaceae bacterium]|nr:hypothetical protein [Roseiflexaceae bacterium]